jgi:hypothetical protein
MMAEAVSQQMVELGNGGVIDGGYVDDVCRRIRERWQDSVQAILDVGGMLIEARQATKHGEWQYMFSEANPNRLPFGDRAARMLMQTSSNRVLSNRNYSSDLPPAWRTLYELSTLADTDLEAAFRDGRIRPDMQQSEAIALKKELRREERDERRAIDVDPEPQDADDEDPPPVVEIGGHVLIFGDNTDPAVIAQLPEGAALAFCDPPYNSTDEAWDGEHQWQQDYISDIAAIVAVTPGISAIQDFMRATAMPYKWSTACLIENGMTRGALGFGNWMYTAIFSRMDSIHRNRQDIERITIKASDKHEDHELGAKRQKPPAYLAWTFDLLSKPGDTVIDLFAGSGTSVVVCEKIGRKCVAVERDWDTYKAMVRRVRLAVEGA